MNAEFGDGKNLLFAYLDPEKFKKRIGFNHPDPDLKKLIYGEGGSRQRLTIIRTNVKPGSHIFFHTTKRDGKRYITGHFFVSKIMTGFEARHDETVRVKSNYHPHIWLEKYPDLWRAIIGTGDYSYEHEKEGDSEDMIVFGDEKKSLGELINPLPFDKNLAGKLEFERGKVKFDIRNKKGKIMKENERINVSTRTPRYITKRDVGFLLKEIASISDP